MSTVWPILAVIACPLGMFAMGGVAWAAAKLRPGPPASPGSRATDGRERRDGAAQPTR